MSGSLDCKITGPPDSASAQSGVFALSGLLQDMRYAVRSLIRWRGVSAAVLVLLATGIGANTAIFGLIHGILMRPLPGVREPDRLVRFLRTEPGDRSPNFGYPDYVDYREQARLFAGIVAESPTY